MKLCCTAGHVPTLHLSVSERNVLTDEHYGQKCSCARACTSAVFRARLLHLILYVSIPHRCGDLLFYCKSKANGEVLKDTGASPVVLTESMCKSFHSVKYKTTFGSGDEALKDTRADIAADDCRRIT